MLLWHASRASASCLGNLLCRYENTESLAVDCPPSVLTPGASQDVSITFSPCEPRLYHEVLPVKINGLYTVRVSILGEGSPLRLELANPAHRSLNLGAVTRGGHTSKSVQVTLALSTVCACPYAASLLHPCRESGDKQVRRSPVIIPRQERLQGISTATSHSVSHCQDSLLQGLHLTAGNSTM